MKSVYKAILADKTGRINGRVALYHKLWMDAAHQRHWTIQFALAESINKLWAIPTMLYESVKKDLKE